MGSVDPFRKRPQDSRHRIFALALLSLILVSDHSWDRNGPLDLVLEFSGFVLIGICTFGRQWSSLYISGLKDRRVVTEGPYSMIRHPLPCGSSGFS